MAEPTESLLTQQLIHSATDPFRIAILAGVACSSFYFFGILSLALWGIVPATMTESARTRKGVSDASALNMWEWMYHGGKIQFISASIFGCISHLVASVFRPDLQHLLYGASFFSFAVIPYTVTVLMPINNRLFEVTGNASKHDGKGPDLGVVDELFGEWTKHNHIRISLSGVGWALGMTVLLLA